MQALLEQYRRLGWILFALSTAALAWSYKSLVPAIQNNQQDWLVPFATGTTIYGMFYLGLLAVYERWAWRWFNPGLYHGGEWHFFALATSGLKQGLIVSRGDATIRQTALSIHLNGYSNRTLYWKIESIVFDRDFVGHISYIGTTNDGASGCKPNLYGVGQFHSRLVPSPAAMAPGRRRQEMPLTSDETVANQNRQQSREHVLVFGCDEWRLDTGEHSTLAIYYTRSPLSDELAQTLHEVVRVNRDESVRQMRSAPASGSLKGEITDMAQIPGMPRIQTPHKKDKKTKSNLINKSKRKRR